MRLAGFRKYSTFVTVTRFTLALCYCYYCREPPACELLFRPVEYMFAYVVLVF